MGAEEWKKVGSVALLLLLLLCFFWSSAASSDDEVEILLSFKAESKVSVGGVGLSDWQPSSSNSFCSWVGITCFNSSVTKLDLSAMNLSSPLSTTICSLPGLVELVLEYNQFAEAFPAGLFACTKLTRLDLSYNLFAGSLPQDWSSLRDLTHLDLGHNLFSGPIPVSLGEDLLGLQSLILWSNTFNGSIPPQLGNLTELQNLTISYNSYSPGVLPSELGYLSRLVWFTCAHCNLVGEFPGWLRNLQNIENLDLSNNSLSGTLAPEYFQWPKIQRLELYFNSFTGPIPASIGNLTSLTDLDLSCNLLNGSIPPELGKLRNLGLLNLWNNSLTGDIPPVLGNLTSLYQFQLYKNSLTGIVPQALGRNGRMRIFDVSNNLLRGPVPPYLCDGGELTKLIFFTNNISGSIPEAYGGCRTLIRVRLGGNSLTGSVPTGIWGMPKMTILELFDNALEGPVASALGNAIQLTVLSISGNAFTGSLPETIGRLLLLETLIASGNRLSGSIPPTLQSCLALTDIDLQRNMLAGSIPDVLGNLANLDSIDVSSNQLSGVIPSSFGRLQLLTYLNLAHNDLNGEIPPELANLQFSVTTFNVSFNDLSGPLPFALAGAFKKESFEGNPDLCVQGLQTSQNCASGRKRGRVSLGAGIACAVLAIVFASLSACYLYRRNRFYYRLRQESLLLEEHWTLTPFEKVPFDEGQILGSLVEDNIIGRGGCGQVYHVRLKDLGLSLAVKKLWVRPDTKGQEHHDYGFRAEIETVGRIRHSNILKLLCCCTSTRGTALLVYEYMPCGSLGDLLHGNHAEVVLDWRTRFKIALGAAQGLAYLHHDCSPPIVHRDVKPNNILLDADFEARIADFGLAKILTNCSEKGYTMTGIAGSVGYIAPELGYASKVNEKSDVYSFGVVLLELITGKRPIEAEFGAGVDIVRWINEKILSKGVSALLPDPKMFISEEDEREILLMLKLALKCTSRMPYSRPSMREVVEVLSETHRQASLKSGKLSKSKRETTPLSAEDCCMPQSPQ